MWAAASQIRLVTAFTALTVGCLLCNYDVNAMDSAWCYVALFGIGLAFVGTFVRRRKAFWITADRILFFCAGVSPFLTNPTLIGFSLLTLLVTASLSAFNGLCLLTNKKWEPFTTLVFCGYATVLSVLYVKG